MNINLPSAKNKEHYFWRSMYVKTFLAFWKVNNSNDDIHVAPFDKYD